MIRVIYYCHPFYKPKININFWVQHSIRIPIRHRNFHYNFKGKHKKEVIHIQRNHLSLTLVYHYFFTIKRLTINFANNKYQF